MKPGTHPEQPTLMEALKAATAEGHGRLESAPFFQALGAGRLPLESYVGQLRALAMIHGVLEQALAACTDPRVTSVWSPELCRQADLERDLHYFEPRAVADLKESVEVALQTAEAIRLLSVTQPVALLGIMYVLEGSMLGAQTLRPLYARAFMLTDEGGLAYLHGNGPAVHSRWAQFKELMNALSLKAADRDGVVQAAKEFFTRIEALFLALFPFSPESKTFLITSINPEAGRHPVPADPREVEVALRAADACWERYPYFEQRYGERGRRFARSDGAWLATLYKYEPARIRQQVQWLGRVLAARGMPTLLLQAHLEILADDLTAAFPEQKTEHEKLRQAAAGLHTARCRYLTDEQTTALAAEFEQAVGPEWNARFPHTGALLAAAVADERGGCERAVESLRPWLSDPTRFPVAWINAVAALLTRASQLASEPPAQPSTTSPAR